MITKNFVQCTLVFREYEDSWDFDEEFLWIDNICFGCPRNKRDFKSIVRYLSYILGLDNINRTALRDSFHKVLPQLEAYFRGVLFDREVHVHGIISKSNLVFVPQHYDYTTIIRPKIVGQIESYTAKDKTNKNISKLKFQPYQNWWKGQITLKKSIYIIPGTIHTADTSSLLETNNIYCQGSVFDVYIKYRDKIPVVLYLVEQNYSIHGLSWHNYYPLHKILTEDEYLIIGNTKTYPDISNFTQLEIEKLQEQSFLLSSRNKGMVIAKLANCKENTYISSYIAYTQLPNESQDQVVGLAFDLYGKEAGESNL